MDFASALSRNPDTGVAVDEVLDTVTALDGHVGFLFATPHHDRRLEEAVRRMRAAHEGIALLGCTGAGVVGGGVEDEEGPALSLTVGSMPGVRVRPFHVALESLPPDAAAWRDLTGATAGCLVVSDPYSFDLVTVLDALQAAHPEVPIVGGQASGGRGAGEHVLVAGSELHRGGLVGLGLDGPVELGTYVAQGCRPIGDPMFVSSCHENRIVGLDGRPPVDVLRDLYASLSVEDQLRFRTALFVGVQMREQQEYHPGDFLIRNLVGVPRDGRGLVVAYLPERFSVVQLHVRDAEAAREDLEQVLQRTIGTEPAGALLFTCVGRGQGLYGVPGHDSGAFRAHVGSVPLGGFFGNGEVGPVQGHAYVHGYTSVFVTFRPRD